MRILVSSTFFSGHLLPLLTYAEAFRHRGHEVLVSAPHTVAPTLVKADFAHAASNVPTPEEMAPFKAALDAANAQEALIIGARDGFLRQFARAALSSLQQTIAEWRPEFILRESFEFAALAAAERASIPHARVSVHSNQHEAGISVHLIDALDEFRAACGLPGDGGASLRAEPIFTAFPAFLDGNADAVGWRAPFRSREPGAPTPPSKTSPAWAPRDGEPLIYITFGTVSGSSERAKATYRAALEAVSALPVRALLTTGPVMDPKALGPIPANVAVETYVPQAEIFPFANAVVCHGGSGSVIGGLAAGLPVVVAPIFADQPVNARSVDAARLGVAVFDREMSGLRSAMQRVLVDAEIRSNALEMARQIAALPTRDDAVDAMLASV